MLPPAIPRRPLQQHSERAGERLDVVIDVAERFPHVGCDAPFATEPREWSLHAAPCGCAGSRSAYRTSAPPWTLANRVCALSRMSSARYLRTTFSGTRERVHVRTAPRRDRSPAVNGPSASARLMATSILSRTVVISWISPGTTARGSVPAATRQRPAAARAARCPLDSARTEAP